MTTLKWIALGLGLTATYTVVAYSGSCCAAPAANAATSPAPLAASAAKSVELEVEGVTCAGCVINIRKALKRLDGVQDIRSGKDKTHLFVDYEPTKVTPTKIVAAVTDAGYGAKVVAPKKK